MRILLDQGTPAPLKRHLADHSVATAYELGWAIYSNGKLLAAAESEFDLLITTDQNLSCQQNLSNRKLAIIVLPTTNWPQIQGHIDAVVFAVASATQGGYQELKW